MSVKESFTSWLTVAVESAKKIDKVSTYDMFQYETCVNLWARLIADTQIERTCDHVLQGFCMAIRTAGFFKVMESADEYAKGLLLTLSGESDEQILYDNTFRPLWHALVQGFQHPEYSLESVSQTDLLYFQSEGPECNSWDIKVAAVAQLVLRFPKRYTSIQVDPTSALQKFELNMKADIQYRRDWSQWPGQCIIDMLRIAMHLIFFGQYGYDPKHIRGALRSCQTFLKYDSHGCVIKRKRGVSKPSPEWSYFSSGSTRSAGDDIMAKFDYLVRCGHIRYNPEVDDASLGRYIVSDPTVDFESMLLRKARVNETVTVSPVPKDYSEARIIGPESPWLNWNASICRRNIKQMLEVTGFLSLMDPDDQSLNRELALMGSIDGSYATLDLSSGSDRIVRSLFFSVLPPSLHDVVRRCISDTIICKNYRCSDAVFATSGSPLTPIMESTFFLSICIVACQLCGFKPIEITRYGAPPLCAVYNDDIIVRSDIAQTVIELLTKCGLVVNQKKSFVSGPFRESCGGEYVLGMDFTGRYWPRHSLGFDHPDPTKTHDFCMSSIAALIALQHKLYHFPQARAYLEIVILGKYPTMTFSPVGTDCTDLWSDWVTPYESEHSKHFTFKTFFENRRYNPNVTYSYLMSKTPGSSISIPPYPHFGRVAVEMTLYYYFLEHGPHFDDPLMELLNCSTPRFDVSQLGKRPVTKFIKVKAIHRDEF